MKRMFTFSMAVWTVLAFTAQAERWEKEKWGDEKRGNELSGISRIITALPLADPVYDKNGNPAVGNRTPIYSDSSGMCDHRFSVLAPNGKPITLGQWRAVEGLAEAKCVPWKGTRVRVHLRNLVPHGVYTVWLFGFKAPGVTPDFANLLGVGALGLPDGSQNSFVASARGEAELSVLQMAGPYSDLDLGNQVPECLFDLKEFLLLGAYHPDGQTHGAHPGDPCSFTVQFAFDFKTHRDFDRDDPLRNTGDVVTLFLRTLAADGLTKIPLPDNAPDSALLWESRFGNPVTAPDGHQITWGEYKGAQSRASATCMRDGTHVVIHASGLVPNATYTVWTLVFNGPFPAGPNGSAPYPFGNLVGLGALGPNDGSENAFHSSASGEGEISVTMPPGLMSTTPPWLAGTTPYNLMGCLTDEVEFHLVGVYHFDGMSYGPTPGYNHGAVEQFGIPMRP